MKSERATPSVTMKSDGTTPKNSLKRVDDDVDTPSEGNVIRRIHFNSQQKRWISCDAIRSFSRNMWLFCILAFLDAICFEAFVQNTAIIYQQKFNMGIQQAGLILAIPCATIIILSPFITIAFERCGKRCFYLMLGFIFVLTSHLIFYSLPKCG